MNRHGFVMSASTYMYKEMSHMNNKVVPVACSFMNKGKAVNLRNTGLKVTLDVII